MKLNIYCYIVPQKDRVRKIGGLIFDNIGGKFKRSYAGLNISFVILMRLCDILRKTQISQIYRYAKISQLLEVGQFYRYVGVIAGFMKPFQNVCYARLLFCLIIR